MGELDKYYKKGEVISGYSILKIIGEGRYGIAYLAQNDKGEKYVVKQLKVDMLERSRKKLFYEEKVLESLDSANFPKFISNFKDEYREGYILEFIEGKVFEDLLARDRHVFTREEIYKVADEILDLVEELHKSNVIHRDIRLPNVIIKKDGTLALIDFGLARFLNNKNYVREIDYWFVADFLLHLYYSSFEPNGAEERPWYEELDLKDEERVFLRRLMSLDESYKSIDEIRKQLEVIRNMN